MNFYWIINGLTATQREDFDLDMEGFEESRKFSETELIRSVKV